MRLLTLAYKRGALLDAEAVLLVRDDEAEAENVTESLMSACVPTTTSSRPPAALLSPRALPRGHCAR
ncbi:MAG: hypothetical protein ACLTG4_00825 [Oscillospiraceae bacterium]